MHYEFGGWEVIFRGAYFIISICLILCKLTVTYTVSINVYLWWFSIFGLHFTSFFFGYGNVIMNTSLEKQKYITVIRTERSPILSVIIQAINKVVGV